MCYVNLTGTTKQDPRVDAQKTKEKQRIPPWKFTNFKGMQNGAVEEGERGTLEIQNNQKTIKQDDVSKFLHVNNAQCKWIEFTNQKAQSS